MELGNIYYLCKGNNSVNYLNHNQNNQHTVQPVLYKQLGIVKMCLLKIGTFQSICFLQETNTCLLNTGCWTKVLLYMYQILKAYQKSAISVKWFTSWKNAKNEKGP